MLVIKFTNVNLKDIIYLIERGEDENSKNFIIVENLQKKVM